MDRDLTKPSSEGVAADDARVDGYFGRVLDIAGVPQGTCFQVEPNVVVTASHVLASVGADTIGLPVNVDSLQGGDPIHGRVKAINRLHDLAVIVTDRPLPSSISEFARTDSVPFTSTLRVTGVVAVEDDADYRFLDAPGVWAGGTLRDNSVHLGRLSSKDVLRGMSGAPVLLGSAVVGVVSGRYNSTDGWLRDSVWVARTEDLAILLAEVSESSAVLADVDGTFRSDILVAHSARTQPWADWVAQQARASGYTADSDLWSWAGAMSLEEILQTGITRASLVIVFSSDFKEFEVSRSSSSSDLPSGRFCVVAVGEGGSNPREGRSFSNVDLTNAGERSASLILQAELQRQLGGPTKAPSPSVPPLAVDSVGATKPAEYPGRFPLAWNLPARNFFFTGRTELLAELAGRLEPSAGGLVAVAPLQGMGGIGKTQLAVEFGYRRRGWYNVVWWVNAEQPSVARNDLLTLADALGLDVDGTTEKIVQSLWAKLRTFDNWLLVYDNVESVTDFSSLRPPDNGNVLMTSRDYSLSRLGSLIEVGVFERSESVSLLRLRCPWISNSDADSLANALGDLPLAVEQAACFLADTIFETSDYLRLLAESPEAAGLADATAERHPGLVAVVSVGFRRLEEVNAEAARLLLELSFLAPEPLPFVPDQPVGEKGVQRFGLHIGGVAQTSAVMRDILRLGLFRRSGTAVQIHRLVQLLIRSRLSEDQKGRHLEAAQRLLASAPIGDPTDPACWKDFASLQPHVLSLLDHVGQSDNSVELELFREIVLQMIRYMYLSSQLQTGYALVPSIRSRWSRILGSDHAQTLRVTTYLGSFMEDLGELSAARILKEENLSAYRRVYGYDDPASLTEANNLGSVLEALEDFSSARDLLHDTLYRRRRVLGEDHPETLLTANNLAVTLEEGLGEFREAYELHDDTLRRYKRLLGHDHPYTMRTATSLASVMRELGDLAGSRALLEETLVTCRRTLGFAHPITLRCEHNLGLTCLAANDYRSASEYFEDVVLQRTQTLGSTHHRTAAAQLELATCMHALGNADRYRELLREALKAYESQYGAEHNTVRSIRAILADADDGQGSP